MVPRASITLYANPACPWAQRGWLALEETKVPFIYETIPLGPEKPASFVELYRSIAADPNATAKVPVLIDGDLKLSESAVVATYVAAKYTQHVQLIPSDPGQAALCQLWVETFAAQVFGSVMQMLGAETREALTAAGTKLELGISVADAFLKVHGGSDGPFFLGSSYSIAETLTTSLAQRAVVFAKGLRDTGTRGRNTAHSG